MNITVGVDAEDASNTALAWLIAQPFAVEAHITLVTSFDMIMSDPLDDGDSLEVRARRMRTGLPRATVETALADSSIPHVLEHWSRTSDLLVIGSNRTEHARSVLSGALPERLAASTAIPLVIVPNDWDGSVGDVVVGVADDDSSDDAVAFAADLAERENKVLRVVHFWQRRVPASDPVTLYLGPPAEVAALHRRRLEEIVDRIRVDHPRLEIYSQAEEGRAPDAFRAPKRTASIIVLGSHRRGLIAGWIAGSVAQTLIAESRAALCVVPPETYVAGSMLHSGSTAAV